MAHHQLHRKAAIHGRVVRRRRFWRYWQRIDLVFNQVKKEKA